MTQFEIAAEFDRGFAFGAPHPVGPNRIAELEHQLAAMTAERDHARSQAGDAEAAAQYANLRMEAAIATSNGLIDAEVARRIAEAEQLGGDVLASVALSQASSAPIPANALRHQSQPIGLLSTADAGRVRLGGYAPSLPPR